MTKLAETLSVLKILASHLGLRSVFCLALLFAYGGPTTYRIEDWLVASSLGLYVFAGMMACWLLTRLIRGADKARLALIGACATHLVLFCVVHLYFASQDFEPRALALYVSWPYELVYMAPISLIVGNLVAGIWSAARDAISRGQS